MTYYIIVFLLLFIIEIFYFSVASKLNIIDAPNHRSSHTETTIRGGGVIFTIAAFGWFLSNHFQFPFFIIGVIAISIISLLDDLFELNNKVRLSIQLLCVILLFLQWDLFYLNWYWLAIALIFAIATINAYNFMDGINGILGSYSLLTIGSLYYINNNIVSFTSPELLIVIGLSLLVFNYFNFRAKAKCFAGDVGSVSMAFIIVFLIGQLVLATGNIGYILLLLVYGIDTAFTVLFRKVRGENIFKAHRSHFYQYLANQLNYSHLVVSFIYFLAQLLINILLLLLLHQNISYLLILFLGVIVIYLSLRFSLEGKRKLLYEYN